MSIDSVCALLSGGGRGGTAVGPAVALGVGVLAAVLAAGGPEALHAVRDCRPTELVPFGLAGLAARGEDDDEIDRLTAKVERFEDGAEVDFSTERDGALGDLYDAVGRLAGTVREHRRESAAGSAGEDDAGAGSETDAGAGSETDSAIEPEAESAASGDDDSGSDGPDAIAPLEADTREDLERKASLLDALFEQAPINLYVKDTEGRHLRTSTPYVREEYADRDEEWFRGKTDRDIYPGDLARESYEDDLRVVESGEPVTEKLEYDPADEEWLVTSKVPWRDDDGEILGLVGVTQYVTEQVERQRKLEAIVENTTDPMYIKDRDGVYRFANDAAAAEFGVDPEEAAGTTDEELFGPEVIDDVSAGDERVLDSGERVTRETQTAIGGEERVFLDQKYPYRDRDGEIIGIMGISREITERKERERELEETKQRLELALEGTNTGIWEWDLETDDAAWGATLERSLGMEPDSFAGTYEAFEERVHPEDRPRMEAALEDAVGNDEPYRVDFRLRHEDGSWRWFESRGRLVDDGGRRMLGVRHDITERRERERQLRETNERLNRIVEASPDAIVALDVDGSIELWNPAAERIFGWSAAAVAGDRVPFVPDDRGEEYEALFERVLDGESVSGVELQRERADGTLIDVSLSAAPLRDEDDDVVGVMTVLDDVTERKERERELRATKERMQKFVETSPIGVVATDTDGVVTLWNDAMERIFGWSAEEVLGEPYPTVPADVAEDEIRQRVLEGESFAGVELERETKGGRRIDVSLSTNPIRDGTGEVTETVGYVEDITERKERERELRRTREMLEQSERLADVGAWGIDVADGRPVALHWTDEVYRIHDRPVDAEIDVEDAIEYYHPDDRSTVLHAVERAIRDQRPYEFEARLVTADGNERWVRSIGDPVVEGGEVVTVNGSIQDVTDRKESERALRERERELQRYKEFTDEILDAIDDVFYIVGPDGSLERWNRSMNEVTGYSDAEIAEKDATAFFPPDHREAAMDAIREAFESGSARVEIPVLTAGGGSAYFEIMATLVENPDGERRIAGIGRDISERRERERELERTTDLLTRAEEMADLGGWSVDVSGGEPSAARWTDSLYDIFEIPRDEKPPTDGLFEYFHPEDRDAHRETVDRAAASGERWDEERRIVTAAGTERWVRTIGEPVVEDGETVEIRGTVQNVTDRKERERELERTRDLLEQAGRVAAIGGWELDLRSDSPEFTWTDELYRLHDLPPDTEIDLETAVDFYHPDDRAHVRERFDRAMEIGEGYDMEVRLQTANDAQRWVRAIGEPVVEDGEVVSVRGSIQDITDQKERELALESLHETTRGLLGTETTSESAELVVEAAADVLDVDCVGVYLLDAASNRLEAAATSPAFDDLCEGAPPVTAGGSESLLWNCFVTGTPTVFDDSAAVDRSRLFGSDVNGGLLVPLGDHGVFVVATPDPPISDETRQLVETLVATAEAAFDRIETETELRERDAELEARNRRLQRQIGITDVIRRVDRSLIGAGSREEVEAAVCDRLAESDDVAFAWIGGLDASGERLDPRAWAGAGGDYLDAIDLAVAPADADPTASGGRAAEPAAAVAGTRDPAVASNVVEQLQSASWAETALAADFHSVVAVPLVYEEYFYGVLAVYAADPDAFGDLERTVFAELAEGIAHSINAVETQRALHADALTELTLRIDEPDDVLDRLARETGARAEYEGLASHSDDETRFFLTVRDAETATVDAFLDDRVAVRGYRLISGADDGDADDGNDGGSGDAGGALYEITVEGEALPSRLVRHGGSPRSLTVTATETEVVVDVPTATDVREFVEMLRGADGDVELVARRTVERTAHTRQELVSSLFDGLTDRQVEVLRTAYYAGFFDWPRASTGEDVAEMLDVTQPTVNRHLRLGQQRLFEQLFDDEPVDAAE